MYFSSLMREITSHHEDVSSGNLERHLSNPVNAFRVTISMHQLLNRSMSLVEESSKRNVEGQASITLCIFAIVCGNLIMSKIVLYLLSHKFPPCCNSS